ncbi:MAG: hypothetical protein NPIRA02_22700 [Nitrospirales bacterium]|nr:MAG: hypothetical protein NPIRA02_22700 [Nitrospirales bacterium]
MTLKTFSDSSIHASHPSFLGAPLLQKALQGLHVLEDKALLATLVSGEGQELPVLTDQELQFLIPWLSEAFAQATPEEYVWFQLTNTNATVPHETSGSLYFFQNLLRVTLHTFQADRRQNKLSSKASFSPTHIRHWTLTYSPATAQQQTDTSPETYPQDAIGSVAIDVTTLPTTKPLSKTEPKTVMPLQREIIGQDAEVQETRQLRKEIEELQEQVDEQNRTLKQLHDRFKQQMPSPEE